MGCFWCGESAMEQVPGVISAQSGYCGGHTSNPTYREVCSGSTGHLESVEVIFDPEKISYKKLLYYFWNNIDPTDAYGQFCDQGSSYKSAIFCSKDQCPVAQDSLMELKASHPYWTIATKIIESKTFWPAEDYHQNYYKKNPGRYSYYKNA